MLANSARRRPGRVLLTLTIAPIVVLTVGGYVALALFPTLQTHHPLILIALDPRSRNLVLVSARIGVVAYFSVALVRRLVSHPLFFLIGRWYGDAGVRWLEKRSPDIAVLIVYLERWFPRFGPLFCAVYPHPLVCTLAGASSMGFAAFALYNVTGAVVIVWLVRAFGFVIKAPVGGATKWISHYSLPLTIVSFALVAYYIWDGQRKGTTKLESVSRIEDELDAEVTAGEGSVGSPVTASEAAPVTADQGSPDLESESSQRPKSP